MNSIPSSAQPVFATTHWSVVVRAGRGGRGDAPGAAAALETLCHQYWYPLYVYVRRLGYDLHSSQDLTQAFFEKLIEKNYLELADRERGRFRWFLLTAFKCFLANEWDRSHTLKRGGGRALVPLDALTAEQRYRLEPADVATPDQHFERRWAMEVLERVQKALCEEYARAGKRDRFDALVAHLPGQHQASSYQECACVLGLTEAAVKQEVYRLRKRYGELLRQEIAQTVVDPAEIDAEIHHLIDAVCRT